MKIAIIGSGISGLVCAHLLQKSHEVTIFEANNYVGGHTHTWPVVEAGKTLMVDTGFIVFNKSTYPNFIKLLNQLQVPIQKSDMSFSMRCDKAGVEYNGHSLNTFFADRKNLIKPKFYKFMYEFLKFEKTGLAQLAQNDLSISVGDFLKNNQFSNFFSEQYLLPIASALWSTSCEKVLNIPIHFIIQFLANHGLLALNKHLDWFTIQQGSVQYVNKILKAFNGRLLLNHRVLAVTRNPDKVLLKTATDDFIFDEVIIATHSDEALALLTDASPLEASILQAMLYQKNEVILHTDVSILPQRKLAWASWNYRQHRDTNNHAATVTYYMNKLQNLSCSEHYCVTLNQTAAINPRKILASFEYSHPVYSCAGLEAQGRKTAINGKNRTHFCGAYWGYGFHEDGVNSALDVCKHFNVLL